MPSPFRSWTYLHATQALEASLGGAGGRAGFDANKAYAEIGDHWQQGRGWPIPGNMSAVVQQIVLTAVEPQFRPIDVIGEVLDNVANGLLDQEPDVSFTPITPVADPKSEEAKQHQAEIDTMVALISAWWDRRKFWEQTRKTVRRSRWAARAAMRLSIMQSALVQTTTGDTITTSLPTNLPFDKALASLLLTAPSPDTGFVYTDPDTEEQCGVFFFNRGVAPQTVTKHVELWFVEDGKTVFRVVHESAADPQEFSLALAERLPIAEMTADLLITDSVRRQQKSLNYFETVLVRVVDTAGFPERYTTNAMPQGVWLTTPPENGPPLEIRDVDGTRYYMHQVPRALGPMITSDLRGIPIGSPDDPTRQTIATPGIIRFEPTDPEYLTKASNHGRQTILRECKQGHLATDSTAESSGNAYVQARAIFGKDLRATKGPLEAMIRDIIEAAIALGEAMSSGTRSESFLAKYRCVVNLHVDTGPPVPAEMAEYRAQNGANLLSRESAMARSGVEDTSAELLALANDPMARAGLWKARGEAMNALVTAGATFEGAAETLGITKDELALLIPTDTSGGNVLP